MDRIQSMKVDFKDGSYRLIQRTPVVCFRHAIYVDGRRRNYQAKS